MQMFSWWGTLRCINLDFSGEQRSPLTKLQVFGASKVKKDTTHGCVIPPIIPWEASKSSGAIPSRATLLRNGNTFGAEAPVETSKPQAKSGRVGPGLERCEDHSSKTYPTTQQ